MRWYIGVKNIDYERVEVTFSKNNEVENDLFKYLEKKARIIGKGTYLKQLLYEHMLKDEELDK